MLFNEIPQKLLTEWLSKGGLLPTIIDAFSHQWQNQLAKGRRMNLETALQSKELTEKQVLYFGQFTSKV